MSEEVEKEIEAKIIEKQPLPEVPQSPSPEPTPVKPKKERTQAQKDAFEKARKKRMENIAAKKEEEAKQPKKPRGRPRKKKGPLQPAADLVKPENYPRPVQHQPHPAVNHNIPYQGGIVGTMPPAQYYQPQPPPQVHNYYYGVNPPAQRREERAPPEEPTAQRRILTSSEEESSEEEYEEAPQYFETPSDARYYEPPAQPTMKYRFG
jgi:hypothetical protein